ncbi:MAG: helix-turn-helix transcriptional regulator [Oscillospiraceae bacterium]|nr:helix-turn-helix transcriptional regulator [Oscillospiraceae bacterium]
MNIDKSLLSGSNGMLILKLLEDGDKYGYQMIEELEKRSDHTFDMKAGTLYPLLHALEEKGWITAYDAMAAGRTRRYYQLTKEGKDALREKEESWDRYAKAVRLVLKGGASFG